jgi:hypothetical protein
MVLRDHLDYRHGGDRRCGLLFLDAGEALVTKLRAAGRAERLNYVRPTQVAFLRPGQDR